jgi:hypothetical protein
MFFLLVRRHRFERNLLELIESLRLPLLAHFIIDGTTLARCHYSVEKKSTTLVKFDVEHGAAAQRHPDLRHAEPSKEIN